MTKDEMETLEDRITNAKELQRRIDYLTQALKDLSKVTSLVIPFDSTTETVRGLCSMEKYLPSERLEGYQQVCWWNQEEGIAEDFRLALKTLVKERLDIARSQYEKL